MLKRLFHFWFGVVSVRLQGRGAARFFCLCAKRGITLWDITAEEENRYHFFMYRDDYFRMRPIRRKTHVRLRIAGRTGAPELFKRYRFRLAFAAACAAAVLFICRMTDYVWKIEIDGNSYLSDEILIGYLNERGCGYGAKKSGIDLPDMELSLRRDFDEIIWATSYIEGTKLVISMQENLAEVRAKKGPQKKDPGSCISLRADCDGTVHSIITRSGTPLVKAGDEFVKGDTLVLGREPVYDDAGELSSYLYLPADADVYAYVVYEYTEKIPVLYDTMEETGRRQEFFYIGLKGKRLLFPFWTKRYACSVDYDEVRQLALPDNFYLPIYFGKITSCEKEQTLFRLGYADAKRICDADFDHFLVNLEENGVSIIRKNVMMIKNGDFYEVTGTVYTDQRVGSYEYE